MQEIENKKEIAPRKVLIRDSRAEGCPFIEVSFYEPREGDHSVYSVLAYSEETSFVICISGGEDLHEFQKFLGMVGEDGGSYFCLETRDDVAFTCLAWGHDYWFVNMEPGEKLIEELKR